MISHIMLLLAVSSNPKVMKPVECTISETITDKDGKVTSSDSEEDLSLLGDLSPDAKPGHPLLYRQVGLKIIPGYAVQLLTYSGPATAVEQEIDLRLLTTEQAAEKMSDPTSWASGFAAASLGNYNIPLAEGARGTIEVDCMAVDRLAR